MRTFIFMVTCALFLVGPLMAGSLQSNLPGVGTFSYNGAPVLTDAPQHLIVAAR